MGGLFIISNIVEVIMNPKSPFQPESKLVVYLRDSGGDEQEMSIEQQEDVLRKWCVESQYLITRVFVDRAKPGSSVVGREQFLEMIDHFRQPDCQETGVVFWSYSRFARNYDESQFYKSDLRRRGFIVHSISDNIPEGLHGKLIEAIIEWKDAIFLEDLSRDVRRGLQALVERYGAVPGTPPRGFTREPVQISSRRDGRPRVVHRWVPDPEQTHLVRLAFQMLLDGKSLAEIQEATHLYKGINCYRTFFTNPIYKGELRYGDLVIDDYCEPIMPPNVWDQVQLVLEKRSQMKHLSGENPMHPRRSVPTYLLSGLVYCARCGSPMCGLSVKKTGGDYYERYGCSRAHRNRDCDSQPIPRIFLENLIIQNLKEYLLTFDNLVGLQNTLKRSDQELQENLRRSLDALQQRLFIVRRRLANIAEAVAEEGSSRHLLNKLKELETEEADILAKQTKLDTLISQTKQENTALLSESAIAAMVERVCGKLDSNPMTVRATLRSLIERVIVERDGQVIRAQIQFYYPPEERPPPAEGDIIGSTYIVDPSLGAPRYRHTFTYSFTTKWIRKKRTVKRRL